MQSHRRKDEVIVQSSYQILSRFFTAIQPLAKPPRTLAERMLSEMRLVTERGAVRYQLTTVLLAPVLFVQGRYVRRVALTLPEAAGPRNGTTGSGPSLRLLVVGDSAAAGVGVATQTEALLGQTVAALAQMHSVHWQLSARTGATTAGTLKHLEKLPTAVFDVAVTSLGVNDVTAGRSLPVWLAQQQALVALLRSKFQVRRIVISGLPPVHKFPALPQPLRWYVGNQVRRFDQALAAWAQTQPDCDYVNLNLDFDVSWLASDKFHPGPPVYQQWGGTIAQQIQSWSKITNHKIGDNRL